MHRTARLALSPMRLEAAALFPPESEVSKEAPAHFGNCRPGLPPSSSTLMGAAELSSLASLKSRGGWRMFQTKSRRSPGFRGMRGRALVKGGDGRMLCRVSVDPCPVRKVSKKESPGRRARASLPLHVPPNRLARISLHREMEKRGVAAATKWHQG